MFRPALLICVVLAAAAPVPPAAAQPAVPQVGGRPKVTGVKAIKESVSDDTCHGVVEAVEAGVMTMVEQLDGNRTVTHRLLPIDVLRDGKVIHNAYGMFAYRWEDVKKGDRVTLRILTDEGEGQTYCLQICIRQRPGAKLPESQKPKDDTDYPVRNLYNDIENGEDVSDELIAKLLPPRRNPRTGDIYPGGLPTTGYYAKYHHTLQATRKRIADEKAKTDLKAPPAEKKDKK